MSKWILAAGAAALAIASPALAERGGHGGGQGGGQDAKAEHGGGKYTKADRGGARHETRLASAEQRAERKSADRGEQKKQERSERIKSSDHRGNASNKLDRRDRDDDTLDRDDREFGSRYADNDRARGFIDGCPPGLAAKTNGCLPPGQAKKLIGTRLSGNYQRSLLPASFRNWYPDNDEYYYREVDGYAYRVNRDRGLIDGLFPLFNNDGNFFSVGQRYPMDYDFYNVPAQYQNYYADNDDYAYRYGDGGIYQVNRSSGMIEGIAALLAGDFGVGQPMPMGYDAYNVPLFYRDRYADSADSMYRYNDGYIYQVDPKTRLIQAVISALI